MATVITDECINCGACEPECPNTAIYQGGVEYEWDGASHAAISNDFFYIVPEKCTECVGFFDHEACAAVCPVDCCVPDPARPESEDALIQRAKQIHPDTDFGTEFPSRFRKAGADDAKAAAPAPGASAAKPAPAAAAAASAPAAPAAKAAAPAPAPPAAKPAGAASPTAAAVSAGGRVERVTARPRLQLEHGDPSIDFAGELSNPFDLLLDHVVRASPSRQPKLLGLALLAASPLLGALGDKAKRAIERGYGDPRRFSSQMATALNVALNFVLYPVIAFTVGVFMGMRPFTEGDRGWIFVGVLVALVETAVRLRANLFHGVPVAESRMGASLYGAPLSILVAPLLASLSSERVSGHVPVEGFHTVEFEAKRERERRYGEVYNVADYPGGYYVRFELPRSIPPSSARDELGIGEEMPDYDLDVSLDDGRLVVKGSIVDPKLRAVCGVSSAFPADFRTEIPLDDRPAGGFRHRYRDKQLEIVVLKQGA